ncbi:hypothetical protein H9P43_003754 [Blastocladiella emersonii ATCC 22665]|nr:hypothetical protein H9P43_003754 [Blastocladiella emersonii ATCC 22665]
MRRPSSNKFIQMEATPIQRLEPGTAFVAWTWAASVTTLVAFASAAVLLTRRHSAAQRCKSNSSSDDGAGTPKPPAGDDAFDTEQFITARGTQPWARIGYSFFAGALGAWAIATPANMAATAGYIGLVSYAVSTGIPTVLVAFAGERMQRLLPRPLSLSDFVLWRYGRVAQVFVAAICILSMALFIVSEYSTIGSVFETFVKSSQYPIIVLVALVTAAYTAYGGLLISIVTDQLQGIFALALTALLVVFVAVTFPQLEGGLPPFPHDTLGATSYGWSTVLTLPCSLVASTFFSEANWQRVWAAESPAALRKGAAFGCALIVVAMAAFGACGLLSMWAFAPSTDAQYANLFLFYVLGDRQYSWVGVLVVVLAVTMNMSAVDSVQNALTATVTANLFRDRPLRFTRAVVFLINVPLMAVGFLTLPALNLFLVSNLLTTGSVLPLLSGLADPHRRYVSGYTMMFGSVSAAAALTGYGWITQGSFGDGFVWAWWGNGYDLFAFLVPLVASVAGLALWTAGALAAQALFGIAGQGYTAEMRAVLDRMNSSALVASKDDVNVKEP